MEFLFHCHVIAIASVTGHVVRSHPNPLSRLSGPVQRHWGGKERKSFVFTCTSLDPSRIAFDESGVSGVPLTDLEPSVPETWMSETGVRSTTSCYL